MSIEDGIKAIEAMIESGRLKVDTAAILAFREDLKRAESKIDAHLEAVRPIVEQPRNEPPTEPTVLCEWDCYEIREDKRIYVLDDPENDGWAVLPKASPLQKVVDAIDAAGLLRLPGDPDPAAGLVDALEWYAKRANVSVQSVAKKALDTYRKATEGK